MSGTNTDLATRATVFSDTMAWTESPADGVWRKRLYHDGAAESGRVTSLVRFDAGSKFAAHDHPDGEEILVLSGTFSDDTGDWGAGSYLLNPNGSPHAPYTEDGCELFVHLRQYRVVATTRTPTDVLIADEILATQLCLFTTHRPSSTMAFTLALSSPTLKG